MNRFWTNYHSHNYYCDGGESPEAQVQAAVQQGVKAFGFSSHCPVPFPNGWSMKQDRLDKYLSETGALKEKYRGTIELYVGMEVDYIPGVCGPADFAGRLDYTIGSIHYLGTNWNGDPWEIDGATEGFIKGLVEVHGGDVEGVLRQYYAHFRQMVQQNPPDVVGHLDKIKIHNIQGSLYDEESDWYQAEIDQTLDAIAGAGCTVEVNTRGVYRKKLDIYPSLTILKKMRLRDIPIMLNSDSHAPGEITLAFAETAHQLRQIGYERVRVLIGNEWKDVPFDKDGLYLDE